jgi:hypothetical protein
VTDEAPKPAPSTEQTKNRLPRIIYWSAYAALIAAAVGVSLLLGMIGLPGWLATAVAVIAAGFAVWFLEDSPLNPNRDLDKDPFNRNFFAVNLQMVRSWKLRVRDVEWREMAAADLPPHAVSAFKDQLGVDPEVSVEADRLLWVAGERDWHGWPDPPRFVVVGFDAVGKVRAADDLNDWPRRWRLPARVGERWAAHTPPIQRS